MMQDHAGPLAPEEPDGAAASTETLEAIRLASLSVSKSATTRVASPTGFDAAQVAPLGVALRATAQLATGALSVVVVTGVWLFALYRPPQSVSASGESSMSELVVSLHQWASWAALGFGALWLIVGTIPRLRRLAFVAIPMVAVAVGALITGRKSRFDQLAVTGDLVGSRIRGAWTVFNNDVLFGLVDAERVSQANLALLLASHIALAMLFVGGAWTCSRMWLKATATQTR